MSASSSKSLPSTFSNLPPDITTSWARRPVTLPSSPRKRSVLTENTRSPPSSWAEDTRNISG